MPVGPLVSWWGGTGAAPPATPSDKFTARYLVGNAPLGDGTSLSVAGFTYILDPGDGSGIQTALAQPSGPGDVYIRPGSYVTAGPISITIPIGVRVVGAGRSMTALTGFNFTLSDGSSLSHLTTTADTGIVVSCPSPASGVSLEDVLVEVNGSATTGIFLEGTSFVNTPFIQDAFLNHVQVQVTVPGSVGILATQGVLLTLQDVIVNGGADSIRVESDAAVFGIHVFCADASVAGIHCANGTGGGPIRLEESAIITSVLSATSVLLEGRVDSLRFHNCFLIGDTASIDMTTADLSNFVCTGSSVIAQSGVLGLGSLSTSQVFFEACTISGYNGIGVQVGSNASDTIFTGCTVEGSTFNAIQLDSKISAVATTFRGYNEVACSVNSTNSNFSGCTFISSGAATATLEVRSSNNTFSACTVIGPDTGSNSVVVSGGGNCFTSLVVDSIVSGAPSIGVTGTENTFSAIRTLTAVAQSGVVFAPSSTNNILLGLNAVGPGSSLVAVSDLGVTNEVAHVIGT